MWKIFLLPSRKVFTDEMNSRRRSRIDRRTANYEGVNGTEMMCFYQQQRRMMSQMARTYANTKVTR